MCNERKLVGFYTGHANTTDEVARLCDERIPCDFVVLSLSTCLNDTLDTRLAVGPSGGFLDAAVLAFWGFENIAFHQISPGETTRPIGVRDARDISVRASHGQTATIVFTCFK